MIRSFFEGALVALVVGLPAILLAWLPELRSWLAERRDRAPRRHGRWIGRRFLTAEQRARREKLLASIASGSVIHCPGVGVVVSMLHNPANWMPGGWMACGPGSSWVAYAMEPVGPGFLDVRMVAETFRYIALRYVTHLRWVPQGEWILMLVDEGCGGDRLLMETLMDKLVAWAMADTGLTNEEQRR